MEDQGASIDLPGLVFGGRLSGTPLLEIDNSSFGRARMCTIAHLGIILIFNEL